MEFTENVVESSCVDSEEKIAMEACSRTIVVNDISDLIPIVLGEGAVIQKDVSIYFSKRNQDASSSDEEQSNVEQEAAIRNESHGGDVKVDVKDSEEYDESEDIEDKNDYAALIDNDDEEYGEFVDHSSSAVTNDEFNDTLNAVSSASTAFDVESENNIDNASESLAPKKYSIPPLTQEQIISIRSAMSKISLKPRFGAELLVDSLLKSKIRIGDEISIITDSKSVEEKI